MVMVTATSPRVRAAATSRSRSPVAGSRSPTAHVMVMVTATSPRVRAAATSRNPSPVAGSRSLTARAMATAEATSPRARAAVATSPEARVAADPASPVVGSPEPTVVVARLVMAGSPGGSLVSVRESRVVPHPVSLDIMSAPVVRIPSAASRPDVRAVPAPVPEWFHQP